MEFKLYEKAKKERIRLAAVDVIGRYITDFNVTSPGLIVQMEALLEKNLAKAIAKNLVNPFHPEERTL